MTKYCTSIYLVFLVLVFPLYYQNNYIDILNAKTAIFVIGTIIYLFTMLVIMAIERTKNHTDKTVKLKKKLSLQMIFFLCFVFALIVTTLASKDIQNAWNAPYTKMFGTKVLLLCCALYLLVPKDYKPGKLVMGAMAAGTSSVLLLTVLNRFQIDILNMYSNLIQEQHAMYLSTIGNANILSSYICLFLPISVGLYLYSKSMLLKLCWAIPIVLGVMAGICSNSDSFFIGYGAAMLVYLWFSLSSAEIFKRYIEIICFSVVAMTILSICNVYSDIDTVWEPIQEFLVKEISWIMILPICFALIFIVKKYHLNLLYTKGRTIILIGLILVVIVLAGYQFSSFDATWGTNRGYVWSNSIALFGELPWFKQLFGIAPGNFHVFFEIPNEIRIKPFVDPHSDFLFYLITTGFFGCIAWLGVIVSTVFYCIKKGHDESVIAAAVLIASLAQGAVNTSIVFTMPYVFVILGLCKYMQSEDSTL